MVPGASSEDGSGLLVPEGSSQSGTPDSWSRRSSLMPEEVEFRFGSQSLETNYDLVLTLLVLNFLAMEVGEAKEEMIEVEAARLILEGEIRCVNRK